jgi:hypothetical protein
MRSFVQGWCDQAILDAGETEPDILVYLLRTIRNARAELAEAYATLEKELTHKAGEKKFTVAGIGEVEIKRQTSRTKWQMDDLLAVIISRSIDEPGIAYDPDGERLPPHAMAEALTERLRECVSMSSGKVGNREKGTGLRGMGIDPGEYCVENTNEDGVDNRVWKVMIPR